MRLLADGRQGTTRAISLLLGGGIAAVSSWASRGRSSMPLPDRAACGARGSPASLAVAAACGRRWRRHGALPRRPARPAAAGGDPRSSGQGPGLVGDPLLAIVVVSAIALLSSLATLLYVRATGGTARRD